MAKEEQPYSSFKAIGVAPQQKTTLYLSGGQTIPYSYQLGALSTVPFVRLAGPSIGQKIVSFNEQIVIPPGELATVENVSYHVGDIWINSGWDPAVRPSRVTVPMASAFTAGLDQTTEMGVDTRRAQRAFIGGFGDTDAAGGTFTITGVARERSHPTTTLFLDLPTPQPRYTSTIIIPPNTAIGLVPLGDKAQPGDTIHDLLDYATFEWTGNGGATNSGSLHFILEYF